MFQLYFIKLVGEFQHILLFEPTLSFMSSSRNLDGERVEQSKDTRNHKICNCLKKQNIANL